MKFTSLRRGVILGWLFACRSRAATKFLAAIVGAVLGLALSGLFGLIGFVDHVGDRLRAQSFGEFDEQGCVEGGMRFDVYQLGQYQNIKLAARCANPPIPPGLDRFPERNEVYVSPALAQLRLTDPDIATRFPRVDGLISRAGLASADELRSINGVEPRPDTAIGMRTFDRFGENIDFLASQLRFDRLTFTVTGLFFTLLPSMYLVATCTRLNARTRERQLGLLSIIGVDTITVRRALTMEAAMTTGGGALVGVLAARPILSEVTPTFVAWRAFPGDLTPSGVSLVLVLSVIVGSSVMAASFASRSFARKSKWCALRQPLDARTRSQTWLISTLRWATFIAGCSAGIVTIWWTSDSAALLVLGGRVTTFVGLIAIVPIACAHLGQLLLRSPNPVTGLVGARLRRPSGTLTRALAALAAGLFVYSAGATTVKTLGPNPAEIQRSYANDGYNLLTVARPSDKTRELLADFDVLGGNTGSADPPTIRGNLTGSCETLRKAVGAAVNCDQAITGSGLRRSAIEGFVIDIVSSTSTEVTSTNRDYDFVLVPLPISEAQNLYSRLIGNDPTVNVQIAGAGAVGGSSELNAILDIFRWGSAFAITIALLAALVSLAALLYGQQSGNNYLQILGLTRPQTATAALTEIGAAAGVAIALSLIGSWLWSLSYSVNTNKGSGGVITLAWPFVLSLTSVFATGAVLVATTLRHSNLNIVPDRDGLVSAHDVFTMPTAPATHPDESLTRRHRVK